MRLYLAGPMTGRPEFNYPEFRRVAQEWRDLGWDVLDPSEKFGGRTDLPYDIYIKASVIDVLACDAIAVLAGWEESRGAALEVHLARVLGYPIYSAQHPDRSGGSGLRGAADFIRTPGRELPAHG